MSVAGTDHELVSVIIPTYNRAKMLVEAIESVRRQTWRAIQIIVVDDGSTDDTVARVQPMEDVLLLQQKSMRQGAARNHGLRYVKGDYVCTLDSDDVWNPDFLERSMHAMRTLNADIVFCNWIGLDAKGDYHDSYYQKYYHWWEFQKSDLNGWRVMNPEAARAVYLEACASPSSALLFRRERIQEGWLEELKIADDWCLILDQLIKRESTIAFTMQPLWVKQVAGDNICDQNDFVEVKRNLHIHDMQMMHDRFKPYLTRSERARLTAHVGFHQYGIFKIDLRAKRYGSAVTHGIRSVKNLGIAFLMSRKDCIRRVGSLSKHFRVIADVTPETLKAEGIRSVEGTTRNGDGRPPVVTTNAKQRTFLFMSSCPEAWGGSEELWSNAALRLAKAGHRVHVVKTYVEFGHPRIKILREAGITIADYLRLEMPVPVPIRIACKAVPPINLAYQYHLRRKNAKFHFLVQYMKEMDADMTIISQGANFDGLEFHAACHEANVPYITICQKASDQKWPNDNQRPPMKRAYLEAKGNFFVAQHNLELTEMQIGERLSNAEVVRNPFLTPVEEPLPWPDSEDGVLRLACVARLLVLEKGQDVLLRVMSQSKWKERAIHVTFYGKGIHDEGLQEMANLLGINSVEFAGFTWNVTDIWRKHHALVLPSRAEGLPLSLIEAMLCGRLGIVTDVGGNAEAVDDNETGFIAKGASVVELDDALERAWQRRAEWEDIGRLAASRVRTKIPADPGEVFTSKLLSLCRPVSLPG